MKLSKLMTIVIITINGKISYKIIKKFYKFYNIIIVENNNDKAFKKKISLKYKKINVLLPKKNLGFGGGNNLALEKVKTPYVLFLGPDVEISLKSLQDLESEIKKIKSFSILAPNSNHFIETVNTRLDKVNNYQLIEISKKEKITEIPWVPEWCMLCNVKDLKKVNNFDENFFLFFEGLDLCKKLRKENKKFFLINDIKVTHHFHGTSQNLTKNYSENHTKLRLWHFYWSSFYYHKKHYGYLKSFFVHISKYIRFSFKKYFFNLIGNKKNYELCNAQSEGLWSQMVNKNSFYRVKLKDKNN